MPTRVVPRSKTDETITIEMLEDVSVTAPVNGDILIYDSTSGEWINQPSDIENMQEYMKKLNVL